MGLAIRRYIGWDLSPRDMGGCWSLGDVRVGLAVFKPIQNLVLASEKCRGWAVTMVVQSCKMYLVPLNYVH